MFTETPARVRGPRRPVDADRDEILAELDTLENRNTSAPEVDGESPSAALEEVRVVDTSQVLAGPTATRVLAEYGAQVTNVMSPYDGQVLAHQYTNNGKRSILLDFKTERGRGIYLQLADEADVVQENFTQGVADRLGVGERQIRTENPEVIYSGVSAYGHGGRRGGYRGREELGQDITGMTVRWGGDGRPRMQPYPVADYGAGNYSAFGILVALYHRMRTGTGQRVHTSLAHAATFHQLPYMISFAGKEWNEPSGIDALGWGPLDRLYRASDRWFYLAALGTGDSDRLATIPGLEGIDCTSSEQLAQAFAGSSAAEWVQRLNDAGIGAHLLMNTEEVMEDSTAKGRGLSLIKDFPDLGELRVVGPSPRLSRTPVRPGYAIGSPGADAAIVLDRIGLGEQLDELINEKAVHTQIAPGTQLVGRVRIKT
jgi:crotonobetainyl-CoA:carnitine CoA-transferase CaiB-like acyl-CoA transferase